MKETSIRQQNKLLELARQDDIYCTWEKSFEDCTEAFLRFAADQPKDIQNILYGYADCGRMAQQRLVNLACKNMVFPDEE